MCRLKPEQRLMLGKLARQDISKNVLMISFSVSRTTVWYWGKQNLHSVSDIPHNYVGKITIEAEITILFLRSLGYGCARIKQRLFKAPEIELKLTEIYVQGLEVSRQSVYKVIKKHKLNGYLNRRNQKAWKFFRASCPNELWQLDMKEFKFEGKKYYFIVCIDDYSRNLLCLQLLDHSPKIPEICQAIDGLVKKYHPKKILTDNNPFKASWAFWCWQEGIEAIFAHLHYPQDKGKVERTNRNITEELINIITKFHKILSREELDSWMKWFNNDRMNLGIKDYPANLYVKY